MKSSVDTNKSSAATPSRGVISADQNSSTSSYPAIAVQEKSTTSLPAKLYRGFTSPIRLLPDFLIIGTQRGGTTSLYHYLQTHPCIAPATIKEVHFFDRRFHKGLAWYRGHFPTWIEKYYAQRFRCRTFLTGEASPSYLFHPHAPGRIAKVLPHVKLIVLLRNPVDRAYSQYYHVVEHSYGTLSFEEAVRDEEERIAKERARVLEDGRYDSYAFRHLSYLSRGIYIDQLQVWMSLFPREQFL